MTQSCLLLIFAWVVSFSFLGTRGCVELGRGPCVLPMCAICAALLVSFSACVFCSDIVSFH